MSVSLLHLVFDKKQRSKVRYIIITSKFIVYCVVMLVYFVLCFDS